LKSRFGDRFDFGKDITIQKHVDDKTKIQFGEMEKSRYFDPVDYTDLEDALLPLADTNMNVKCGNVYVSMTLVDRAKIMISAFVKYMQHGIYRQGGTLWECDYNCIERFLDVWKDNQQVFLDCFRVMYYKGSGEDDKVPEQQLGRLIAAMKTTVKSYHQGEEMCRATRLRVLEEEMRKLREESSKHNAKFNSIGQKFDHMNEFRKFILEERFCKPKH